MFPHDYLTKPVDGAKVLRGRCHHWRCRRAPRPGRKDCATCHKRKCRMRDDVKYAFNNLRDSARKRGIAFLLTYEEFAQWSKETGYSAMRGKDALSASCDRRETDGPYALWNIRLMTYGENVSHVHEQSKELADIG